MPLDEIRVPGKVILSGEYAVLVGGEAAVIPVDRWLRAIDVDTSESQAPAPVVRAALSMEVPELPGAGRLSERRFPRFDTSAFFDDQGRKLGLGLSAAEAVATVLWRLLRERPELAHYPETTARLALQAHRQAQGGVGSGADVYACALQHPMIYAQSNGTPTVIPAPGEAATHLPIHIVYSGASFDTRAAIGRFDRWRNGHPGASQLLDDLIMSATDLSRRWWAGSQESFIGSLDTFVSYLRLIDAEAGLGYWTTTHSKLDRWARGHGGRAKPAGAGGDMILLVGQLPMEDLAREFDTIIRVDRFQTQNPVKSSTVT